MRAWLLRLSLCLGPLALAELGARAFRPAADSATAEWHFRFDPARNYRWRPSHRGVFGAQSFETNPESRIGRSFPPGRSTAPRIAVLGDSVAFGFNVPYPESFVPLLEESLQAEILNFSVPGYASFQHFHDLEEAIRYCPDLVLWQISFNDLVEPFLYLRRLGGSGIDYHRIPDAGWWHFLLREHSRLYRWLSDALLQGALTRYGKEEMLRMKARERMYDERMLFEHPDRPEARAALSEFARWRDRIAERCRQAKLSCLALLAPNSIRHFTPGPQLEAGVARLREGLAEKGLAVLDPWPELAVLLAKGPARDPVARWNRYFLDQIHPAPAGHRFLASFLHTKLRAALSSMPVSGCKP